MSVSIAPPASEPSINSNVLMEILGNSQPVAERIRQYKEAKAAAEKALEELKVGKDARAAYDEADKLRQQAQHEVKTAAIEADKAMTMLAEAHVAADKMIAAAQNDAAVMRSKIEREWALHLDRVRNGEDDLARKHSDVSAARKLVDDAGAVLEQKTALVEKAKADAEAVTQRAKKAEAAMLDRVKRLDAALAGLTG